MLTTVTPGEQPANIVITAGSKQLVLVDFGSAWPVEESAVKAPGDGVTQPYAAPERLAKHAVEDFRSDVFSLSVVAYEMLTLEIPFDGLGGQAGLPNLVAEAEKSYRPPSGFVPRADRLPSETGQRYQCQRGIKETGHQPRLPSSGSGWAVPASVPFSIYYGCWSVSSLGC